MIIKVEKRHIREALPIKGKDPISLALQDKLKLPERCIRVTISTITILDYNGAIRYTTKLSEDGKVFLIDYYNYVLLGKTKPKPFKLVIEPVDYIIEKINLIQRIAREINNDGEVY